MPYLTQKNKELIDIYFKDSMIELMSDYISSLPQYNGLSCAADAKDELPSGYLNYIITGVINNFTTACLNNEKTEWNYERINKAMGVLESVKQEFYRRVAVPYEEKKIAENGDVY